MNLWSTFTPVKVCPQVVEECGVLSASSMTKIVTLVCTPKGAQAPLTGSTTFQLSEPGASSKKPLLPRELLKTDRLHIPEFIDPCLLPPLS
mmetsp:Transcript_128465/g.256619  ORF Transcript_128465/g.256619 Transcript_128465/m.256619 type:complete len:91 (-) Transcript_128465:9-281(-)